MSSIDGRNRMKRGFAVPLVLGCLMLPSREESRERPGSALGESAERVSQSCSQDCTQAHAFEQEARQLGQSLATELRKENLYRRAVELCPSFAKAHNNLGDLYERQGRFEEAIAQYKKAIEISPSASEPHFGLGDIYFKTGQRGLAIQWYESGLKLQPDDSLTRNRLAVLRDLEGGAVISASTIQDLLCSTKLRGPAEVVWITFGEGLIPFDFDKADIREDARSQLDEIGKALQPTRSTIKDVSLEEIRNSVFEIAGHTDVRGTDEYNLILSRRRAEAVVEYLVAKFNIPRDMLDPVGYGKQVVLCTSSDEASHALNRRVTIRRMEQPSWSRVGVRRGSGEGRDLAVEMAFLYRRRDENLFRLLDVGKELPSLRSGSDMYTIFFRPLQECYVYIIQEDAAENVHLLFPPDGAEVPVKSGRDYWIPGPGKAFTLDQTKGEEKIYMVVSGSSLTSDLDGLQIKQAAQRAARSLRTRRIGVVGPTTQPVPMPSQEADSTQNNVNAFLTRVEGEEGWVREIRFQHQ